MQKNGCCKNEINRKNKNNLVNESSRENGSKVNGKVYGTWNVWGESGLRGVIAVLAVLVLVGAAGCSADVEEPEAEVPDVPASDDDQRYVMAFSPVPYTSGNTAASRSENPGASASRSTANDVAEALGKKFAVVGWKRNANGDKEWVFAKDASGNSAYIVNYEDSEWGYAIDGEQYVKYWDLGAKNYTFYSIANYPEGTTFSNGYPVITGISATTGTNLLDSYYLRVNTPAYDAFDYDIWETPSLWQAIVDSHTPQNNPENNPNEGNPNEGNPTTNNPTVDIPIYYTPHPTNDAPAVADIVPLPFHHLLAQVQFKIYNKRPDTGVDIAITSVSIKIKDEKQYYTTADYKDFEFTNLQTPATAFIVDAAGKTIKSGKTNATPLYQSTVIPQALGLEAAVVIETGVGTFNGTITLGSEWAKGTVYTYYLAITYSGDLIMVSEVEIDDWAVGKEIENTQTNW